MSKRTWLLVLTCLPALACGPRGEGARQRSSPSPAAEASNPRGVGICRSFGIPGGFDTGGRRVDGAVPGELLGGRVGDGSPFPVALAACVQDPDCDGVTSEWYLGMPWFVVRDSQRFAEDEDSYACTALVGDRP